MGVGVTQGGLREVGLMRGGSHVRWVSREVGLCEVGLTQGELREVGYAR